MILDPVIPVPWIASIAALAIASAVWFQWHSTQRLNSSARAFLLITRLASISAILFILLQPSREEKVPIPEISKNIAIALDTSFSMLEPHEDGSSRIDAARADMASAGLLAADPATHHFFTFSGTTQHAGPESILISPPNGKTSAFHKSITSLVSSSPSPSPSALFLFSDGHDLELVPAATTARFALSRQMPIYAIPYGTSDSARDLSIRITNYHSHTFIRQKIRLDASIRISGAPHETITVDLLRGDKLVSTQQLLSGTENFLNIAFDVLQEEPGQYEYTFRIRPLPNEKERSNNSATTFLNVISERIRILEIEGSPFWDSTFLRRSFTRNDKFDIDSLVAFTNDRVRPIRSNPDRKTDDLKPPSSAGDLAPYSIVILGRNVHRVIGTDGISAISDWVENHDGILIFSRGKAWPSDDPVIDPDLEPISWSTMEPRGSRISVTPQASSVPAFSLLREVAAAEKFPEVIAYPALSDPGTLSSTFSVTEDQSPAIVYRRFGNGQTMSLGVGNLWRWVFNPDAEYDNNAYDRFWDQLALWLLSNGNIDPTEGFNLRADTVNLPLGEPIHISLSHSSEDLTIPIPPLSISKENIPVTSLDFTPGTLGNRASTSFTPRESGRYLASFSPPHADPISIRFIVFQEDLERTETAMDVNYLRQLSESSGGKLVQPSEIPAILASIFRDTGHQDPLVRIVPIWDHPSVYLLLCFLLGTEWYARRRWGLS